MRTIVRDKLMKNDKSFHYDMCLISELLDKQEPEPNKIYFKKLNNSKLKYIVLSPTGEKIESALDLLVVEEKLTKEFLVNKKIKILTIVSERGHTYDLKYDTKILSKVVTDLNDLCKQYLPEYNSRIHLLATRLYNIISDWDRSCINYKNAKLSSKKVNGEVKKLNRKIHKSETAYKITQDRLISLGGTIDVSMEQVKNSITVSKFQTQLMLRSPILYQNKIKSSAMHALFSEAEKLGLESHTPTIGRGNINPILKFVRIISGIDDGKILNKYYKKYKQNSTENIV